MKRISRSILLTVAAIGGCTGNGSLTSLNPDTEFSSPIGPLPDGGPDYSQYGVGLFEAVPGGLTCQQIQSGVDAGYHVDRGLLMVIGTTDGSDLHPGTYNVVLPLGTNDAGSLLAVLGLVDSDGGTIGTGIDGTVTLTQVVLGFSGSVAGSYSSTLVGADGGTVGTISGSFSAPACKGY
jgi:hypothetical protein